MIHTHNKEASPQIESLSASEKVKFGPLLNDLIQIFRSMTDEEYIYFQSQLKELQTTEG